MKIREIREAAGLTLDQAAELLGFEPHVLAGFEKGWRQPTKRQRRQMMEAAKELAQRSERLPGAARLPEADGVGPSVPAQPAEESISDGAKT